MSIINSPYQIFTLERKDFLNAALEVFNYQARHCEIYKQYIQSLARVPQDIKQLEDIPFLPIQFFKTHKVVSIQKEKYLLFESSATTSQIPAKHYVANEELYQKSLLLSFEHAMGPVKDLVILGLLPHYLERKNSSLVYMVNYLMKESGHELNGFYLNKEQELFDVLNHLETIKQPTILFGVTFALLDFAKKYKASFNYVKIIETGGMKGRKKEITRQEVHHTLQKAFNTNFISSEYGMAELLSQSYYTKYKKFSPPQWKKILIRDVYDPFEIKTSGKGGINIIDLANINSCSFIATDDLGELDIQGHFEVLGRLDTSEIRGCNLLLES